MIDNLRCLSNIFRVLMTFATGILFCCANLTNAATLGLLDNFEATTEAIQITPNSMFDYGAVSTGIGEHNWQRTVRTAKTQARLEANYDVNRTNLSSITAQIDQVTATTPNNPSPVSGFVLDYDLPTAPFGGVDLSGGGLFDAMAFDFNYLRGPHQPSFFRVWLIGSDPEGGPGSVISVVNRPGPNDDPFRIVLPFDQFTTRANDIPGAYDPSFRMHKIEIVFLWIFEQGQFDWSMSLNNIRFVNTASIPEPSAISMAICVLIGWRVLRKKNR